jgi:peptidoglycan hydrolase-like protein with peptidoglycan-binding domain
MAFSLTWLPDILKQAGLKVAEVPGWQTRGHGDVGQTLGVLCHHTAGARNGNMPSLQVLVDGRTGLRGPLSQLGLGRDGTFYVVAAGRCQHAGTGVWQGISTGNTNFIGIEAENTGVANDTPWPKVQVDAYHRGVAAILKHLGLGVDRCAGHKEYAPNRKTDPSLDMVAFRNSVAAILSGAVPEPTLIPAVEPPAELGGTTGRVTLRRGASGALVSELQALLGLVTDGEFGGKTEAAVREFQRAAGLVPDGIVGPKTWAGLDRRVERSNLLSPATAPTPIARTFASATGETMTHPSWPNNIASKVLASYIHLKYDVSPSDLMFFNPPMGAMPFFNNSASPEIRRFELELIAGKISKFLTELLIPLEAGKTLIQAQTALLTSMLPEDALSSGMAKAIDDHYRFVDEANA